MDREEAAGLLSEYVLGRLPAGQADAVAAHVAADAELERMAAFLHWLAPRIAQMQDHVPGAHATGEELVAAVLDRSDVPNERADWVREHLVRCGECARLADLVREVDAAGAADAEAAVATADVLAAYMIPAERSAERPVGPVVRERRAMRWRPALAAALALLVFGTGIWFGSDRDGGGVDAAPVRLAAVTRGADTVTVVERRADGALPPFILACDPWVGRADGGDFALRATLRNRDSAAVLAGADLRAAAAWSAAQAGLRVGFATQVLPAGDYTVTVADESGRIICQAAFRLLPR